MKKPTLKSKPILKQISNILDSVGNDAMRIEMKISDIPLTEYICQDGYTATDIRQGRKRLRSVRLKLAAMEDALGTAESLLIENEKQIIEDLKTNRRYQRALDKQNRGWK